MDAIDISILIPQQLRGVSADEDKQQLLRDEATGGDAGAHLVTPGETITADPQYMKGHGAYAEGESTVVSSVGGVVERVNKLVTVRALRTRYSGHVGDVVVGRVAEIGNKRWRVDINSRQDAILLLSSIHLPGGVQRRKSESDELAMRSFFAEGDLLVAEAQQLYSDNAVGLHTRSTKYGKLRNGQLVVVPPSLIQRCKSHFHSLPCGVDVILGLNGYIWVSMTPADAPATESTGNDITAIDASRVATETLYSSKNDPIPRTTRANLARVANCIQALARNDLAISDTMIVYAYEASLVHDRVADLLKADVMREIALQARRLYELSLEA
ncbi:Exosome complex component rrp4 [Blastocladiella emersonii ATCC 22665]|nr:Exosome complex component rrp4 [Blastocladiella emersonii ATCC 22665]